LEITAYKSPQTFSLEIAWDILPITLQLQSIIPTYRPDTPCLLCKTGPDSIRHIFFHCHYARVIWHLSPWPLDSTTLDSPNLCNWIRIILSLGANLHIPRFVHHQFQVFVVVTCDLLWFHRNKAFHDGLSFDARILAKLIIKNYHQHCNDPPPMTQYCPLLAPHIRLPRRSLILGLLSQRLA
jgi:hypothetical protein